MVFCRSALRFLAVLILAAALDGYFPGTSFLLGSSSLFAVLSWSFLPFCRAAVAAFSFGLFLDGTHLSLLFGVNALSSAGFVFCLRLCHRHILLGTPRRLFAATCVLTAVHYVILSISGPAVSGFLAAGSCLLSCIFNGCILLLLPGTLGGHRENFSSRSNNLSRQSGGNF